MKQALTQLPDHMATTHLFLTGCQPFDKSTKSQIFLSCKDFISFFVALYHDFCCSQGSLAISWYYFGIVHSP